MYSCGVKGKGNFHIDIWPMKVWLTLGMADSFMAFMFMAVMTGSTKKNKTHALHTCVKCMDGSMPCVCMP